ncbi:MAG: YggS family pyridoxal phosphate-dependent enzyme [Flavobacteriales bacterium]
MKENLVENLKNIESKIPKNVVLVAVSKTKPMESIVILYEAGQRVFGENRVEELVEKHENLPKDIDWHMIGHLQSKKVKKIASFIGLVHAVDSLKLLEEINKQAKRHERKIDCLLQFHIAQEESKYGLTIEIFRELIALNSFEKLQNITIKGVMGMATFTSDKNQVRKEFQTLKRLSKEVKTHFEKADIISMGMSGDFLTAIEEGSNMVRVGSSIFGARK